MILVMLGRVLFALVTLIIGAALVVPVYPTDEAMSGPAPASALLIADRALADAGTGPCSCLLPAAFSSPDAERSQTVYLIVPSMPAGHLAPKLPAI